jgi:hypothetical protein
VNDKENEIEHLKGQLKTSSNIGTSNSLVGTPNKFEIRRPSIERKSKMASIPTRT